MPPRILEQRPIPSIGAFSLSIFGAMSDGAQKSVGTRIALGDENLGGYFAARHYAPGYINALRGVGYAAAILSMLLSLTLETPQITLIVHKFIAGSTDVLRNLWRRHGFSLAFFIALFSMLGGWLGDQWHQTKFCSLSFFTSCCILYVNGWSCAYSTLNTIDGMSDCDFLGPLLETATYLFTAVNIPLTFATDGGFFAHFVRRVVGTWERTLTYLIDKWKSKPQSGRFLVSYPGLELYTPLPRSLSSEHIPLLETALPADMRRIEYGSVGQRIWRSLTDMSKCFDEQEVLYVPKKISSMVAWFFMQYIIGPFNALIEAGFAAAVLDDMGIGSSVVLYHMMIVAGLQSLGLDSSVSASSAARLFDASRRRKDSTWFTFCLTLILGIFCGAQAFAVGFVGMQQMIEQVLVHLFTISETDALILNYIAGAIKLLLHTGVELTVFFDKARDMFPTKSMRTRMGFLSEDDDEPTPGCCGSGEPDIYENNRLGPTI